MSVDELSYITFNVMEMIDAKRQQGKKAKRQKGRKVKLQTELIEGRGCPSNLSGFQEPHTPPAPTINGSGDTLWWHLNLMALVRPILSYKEVK
jgi:hypothetical protein